MRIGLGILIAFWPFTRTTEIRLIIKGDDMGAAHGINVATIDAYKRGSSRRRTSSLLDRGFLKPSASQTRTLGWMWRTPRDHQ